SLRESWAAYRNWLLHCSSRAGYAALLPSAQAQATAAGRMQLARRPRPQTTRHGGRMGPFHLESIAAGGDRAVLRIDGDIDACTAPQLRERVMDLAGDGTVHVIADLRGVGFLDSAGLGALVAA